MCNRNKVFYSDCGKKDYNMEQTERDLVEQAAWLKMRKKYNVWEQRCDEFIELLNEHNRIKWSRLSIGVRQSLVVRIARLESLKDLVRGRFVHMGAGYNAEFRWREIDTAFENRILNSAVINSKHIESISRRCEWNCARSCARCAAKIRQYQDKHCV